MEPVACRSGSEMLVSASLSSSKKNGLLYAIGGRKGEMIFARRTVAEDIPVEADRIPLCGSSSKMHVIVSLVFPPLSSASGPLYYTPTEVPVWIGPNKAWGQSSFPTVKIF